MSELGDAYDLLEAESECRYPDGMNDILGARAKVPPRLVEIFRELNIGQGQDYRLPRDDEDFEE